MTLSISSVIPTKNRKQDLLAAVISILEQTRLPDELIVIDQSNSSEAQPAVSDLVATRAPAMRLVYVYDPSINGLIDAKRAAVAQAKSDIVCFHEDDVVLEPAYIEETEKAFIDNPAMLGSSGIVTNVPMLSENYRRFFHLFHRGIFYDKRVDVHGVVSAKKAPLIPSRYLSGGLSAYRSSVFDAIPYDLENHLFMLEDIDFSTRAADHFGNEHFYINPNARLAHNMSPANRAVLEQKYARKLREFIIFYKKHASTPGAGLNLLWLLTGLFLETVLQSASARKISPLRGYFKGLLAGYQWRVRKEKSCR